MPRRTRLFAASAAALLALSSTPAHAAPPAPTAILAQASQHKETHLSGSAVRGIVKASLAAVAGLTALGGWALKKLRKDDRPS